MRKAKKREDLQKLRALSYPRQQPYPNTILGSFLLYYSFARGEYGLLYLRFSFLLFDGQLLHVMHQLFRCAVSLHLLVRKIQVVVEILKVI